MLLGWETTRVPLDCGGAESSMAWRGSKFGQGGVGRLPWQVCAIDVGPPVSEGLGSS